MAGFFGRGYIMLGPTVRRNSRFLLGGDGHLPQHEHR